MGLLLTKHEVKMYGLLTKCEVKMYGLLTKREVKMAGYWPNPLLRVYRPRQSRGP